MIPSTNNYLSQLQISVEKTVHCVADIVEADEAELESIEPAYIPQRQSGDMPFSDLPKV